jgi:hypothetical protein
VLGVLLGGTHGARGAARALRPAPPGPTPARPTELVAAVTAPEDESARAEHPPHDQRGASDGPLASVRVRVVDPSGAPLTGTEVVLRHGAREWARARLDARGACFAGLIPGRYSLAIATDLPAGLLPRPHEESGDERTPFTLARGAAVELVLHTLEAAEIDALVLDASGAPLEGAWVRAHSLDLTSARPWAEAWSDAAGRAALRELVPGSYRLHATLPEGAGAAPQPRRLVLEPGARARVTLSGEPEPRAVCGRLVGEDGQPRAGVELVARVVGPEEREDEVSARPPRGRPLVAWSSIVARARTDAAGRFRLADLPRARVELRIATSSWPRRPSAQTGGPEVSLGLAALELAAAPPEVDLGDLGQR